MELPPLIKLSMSSNLIQSQSVNIGYNIPEGATWNTNFENGRKEGKVEVVGKYGIQLADLMYKNDKLNGVCTFYESGVISETIHYVDDVAEGWSCEYDNGEEARCYIYRKGYKVFELLKNKEKNGYWNEIDIESNKIVCSCLYNEDHEKDGIGYVYNDGNIEKSILFEKGNEVQVMKVFVGQTMSEFDENGILIYEGGYLNSIAKDYPREGKGIELVDGKMKYEGEWKNNKKEGFGVEMKNNFAYYNGYWKNDLPNGEGRIMDKGKVLYKGEWKNGVMELSVGECFDYKEGRVIRKENVDIINVTCVEKFINDLKVIVRSERDWKNLNKEVTELVIAEGVCNEMRGEVMIEGLDCLKSIVVKANSMKYVKRVEISSLIDLIQFIRSSSIDNIHYR